MNLIHWSILPLIHLHKTVTVKMHLCGWLALHYHSAEHTHNFILCHRHSVSDITFAVREVKLIEEACLGCTLRDYQEVKLVYYLVNYCVFMACLLLLTQCCYCGNHHIHRVVTMVTISYTSVTIVTTTYTEMLQWCNNNSTPSTLPHST